MVILLAAAPSLGFSEPAVCELVHLAEQRVYLRRRLQRAGCLHLLHRLAHFITASAQLRFTAALLQAAQMLKLFMATADPTAYACARLLNSDMSQHSEAAASLLQPCVSDKRIKQIVNAQGVADQLQPLVLEITDPNVLIQWQSTSTAETMCEGACALNR